MSLAQIQVGSYNGAMDKVASVGANEAITVVEAAEMKAVSRQAVYDAMKAGKLPHRKSGHVYLLRRRDVDRWQPEHRGPKKGSKKEPL
jgi:excisionase family DNA binding protein